MNVFDISRQTRKNIEKVVAGLSLEQLNTIPPGFNNNLLWNLGHVVVTQQALTNRLGGLPINLDADVVDQFKKGTKASHYTQEMLDFIKSNLISLVDTLENDYSEGKFKSFQEYPTSYGVTLTSIEDALSFNNAHEALHLGYMMALRRSVLK